jgi:hypothetical protein
MPPTEVAFPGIRSFPQNAQDALIESISIYVEGIETFPPRFQDVLEENMPAAYSHEELGAMTPEEVGRILHYNTARALLSVAEIHMMLAVGVDD